MRVACCRCNEGLVLGCVGAHGRVVGGACARASRHRPRTQNSLRGWAKRHAPLRGGACRLCRVNEAHLQATRGASDAWAPAPRIGQPALPLPRSTRSLEA